MNNIRIKKVKHMDSVGKIIIEYERLRDEHCDLVTLASDEEAAPEFYDAFDCLTGPVLNILEIEENKLKSTVPLLDRITPYGVTFHYDKNDVMGAVISVKFSLPEAGSEVVINTPMRKCKPDEQTEGSFFTESMAKFLWGLEGEARKYVSGKRAQMSLFGENGDTDEEEDPEVADAAAGHPADPIDDVPDLSDPVPFTATHAAQVIDFPEAAQH